MGRIVEIGRLREKVEILDEPMPPIIRQREQLSPGRIGRIKHANGENAAIDHETLRALMQRAEAARAVVRGPSERRRG